MVLDADFSLVSISRLSLPAASVLAGSWLIVAGHGIIGPILIVAGFASYFIFGQIITSTTKKLARAESRKEANRIKRLQEARQLAKEKAEQHTLKFQERERLQTLKADQENRKLQQKGAFVIGKKILDEL